MVKKTHTNRWKAGKQGGMLSVQNVPVRQVFTNALSSYLNHDEGKVHNMPV